jgi:hypothetical protein
VDDSWRQEWGAGRLLDRKAAFLSFVEGIEEGEPPTLHFLHVLLPHPPMSFLPSGKIYSVDGGVPGLEKGGLWSRNVWTVTQNHQRFLLQVGFVDSLVGQLIARLRETKLYDESLILVTADHGISFRAGDYRRKFSETNYQDILPVPLFVKTPHQRVGTVNLDNVETVDILPIIADGLQIDVPWVTDGRSSSEDRNARNGKGVPAELKGKWSGWASTEAYEAARDASLRHKLEIFGSGESDDRLFKIGPYASMIGRSLDDFQIHDSGQLQASLFLPMVSGSLNLEEDFIPSHLTGSLNKRGPSDRSMDLALAINNVIQATTTTRRDSRSRDAWKWSAVVEESSFISGANDYRLFLINRKGDEIQLQATHLDIRSPALGDIPFGVSRVLGVEESGFQPTNLGSEFRWTTGDATLVIPISRHSPPRLLRVEIRASGPDGTKLRIEVNGESVFDARIPAGEWAEEIDVSEMAPTDELTVRLVSETFQQNRKTLGVAVEGIWLKGND